MEIVHKELYGYYVLNRIGLWKNSSKEKLKEIT